MNVGDLVFAPLTRSRPHDLQLARITGFQSASLVNGTVSFEFLRENLEDSSDVPQRVFQAPAAERHPHSGLWAPSQRTFAALDKMRALLAKEHLGGAATTADGGGATTTAAAAVVDSSNAAADKDNSNGDKNAHVLKQLQMVFPLNTVADAWSLVLRELLSHQQMKQEENDVGGSGDDDDAQQHQKPTTIFLMDNWSSAFLLHTPCVLGTLLECSDKMQEIKRKSEDDEDSDDDDKDDSFDRAALLQEIRQQRSVMHESIFARGIGAKMFEAACNFVSALLNGSSNSNNIFSFVILFADSDSAALWSDFLQSVFSPLLVSSGFSSIVSLGDVGAIEEISQQQETEGGIFVKKLFMGSAEEFTTLCTRDMVRGETASGHNSSSCSSSVNKNKSILVLLGDDSLEIANTLAEMEMLMFECYQNNSDSHHRPSIIFEHIDASVHLAALKGHGGTASASSSSSSGVAQQPQTAVRSRQKKHAAEEEEEKKAAAAAAAAQQQQQEDEMPLAVAADFVFDGADSGTTTKGGGKSLARCRWGCCATSCCPFLPCFPVQLANEGSSISLPRVAADMFMTPPPSSSSPRLLRLVLVDLSSDAAAGPVLDRAEQQGGGLLSSLRVEFCRVTVDTSLDLCSGICRQLLSHWMRGQIDGVVVATAVLEAFDTAATSSGPPSASTPLRNIACFVQSFLFALNACALCGAMPATALGGQQQQQQLGGLMIASPSSFVASSPHNSSVRRRYNTNNNEDASSSPSNALSSTAAQVRSFSLTRRKLQPIVFVRLMPSPVPLPARVPLVGLTVVERLLMAKSDVVSTVAPLGRRAVSQPFDASNETQSALRWFSSVVL